MVAGEETGKAENGILLGGVGLAVGFYRVFCSFGQKMRFAEERFTVLRAII